VCDVHCGWVCSGSGVGPGVSYPKITFGLGTNLSNPFNRGLSGLILLLEDNDEVTSRAGGGKFVERSCPSQLKVPFLGCRLVELDRPILFFISGDEFSAPEAGGVMYAFRDSVWLCPDIFLLSFLSRPGL